MKKIDTLLFDLDTERQYTYFWSGAAKKYGAQGGADFSLKIKGTPLEKILDIYFPRLDGKGRAEVRESLSEFEKKLVFRPVKGAVEFLESARNLGYKTGLVTSSGAAKMRRVFAESDYGRFGDSRRHFARKTRPNVLSRRRLQARLRPVALRRIRGFNNRLKGRQSGKYVYSRAAYDIPKGGCGSA